MIRLFAAHPTAANLMMVFALLLGLVALPNLNRETFPEIKTNTMQVTVAYPGASALEIESSICSILEDGTTSVRFVQDKTCEAREGVALFNVKMQAKGNFKDFKDEVTSAVDAISDLPDNATDPVINELGKTQAVVTLAITGPEHEMELYQLARDIKDELQREPNIPQVSLSGFGERQIRIEVDPEQLQALNLSLNQLSNIIRSQNKDLPLGVIETSGQQIGLKVSENRTTVAQLSELIIRSGNGSSEIRLGDIAKIENGFKDADSRILLNGQRAAYLTVSKTSLEDSLNVVASLEHYMQQKAQLLPPEVNFTLVNNNSAIVKDRITMIVKNGWQGLILVVLVMTLFFSFRYSFWVAMGLPVSFMMGFFMMSLLGMSINMISMVGLLIAIGILMDDAIVISESIAREIELKRSQNHIEQLSKYDILDATVAGVKRVGRGIVSSFLTTVFVFGGATMIEGDIGQVLKALPIVLISVVSVSLIEAFLILPSHLAHSIRPEKAKPNRFQQGFDRQFDRFAAAVGKVSQFAIRQPYLVIGFALALFFSSVSMLAGGVLKFQAFPTLEGDVLELRIQLPQGSTEHRTLEVIDQALSALQRSEAQLNEASPLVDNITIKLSQNADAYESGNHLATISLDLNPERDSTIATISSLWRSELGPIIDATTLLFKEPALGPAGKAIQIELKGHDLRQLSAAASSIQQQLALIDGVLNVQNDLNPGKPELHLTMKPGAYSLGIDASMLANQLRTAYQGTTADQVQIAGETVDIALWYPEHSRDSLEDLEQGFIIQDQTGQLIPLEQLADLSWQQSWSRIYRDNGLRVVKVLADIDATKVDVNQVNNQLRSEVITPLLDEQPSLNIGFAGEAESSQESVGSLAMGFLMGLFAVYVLLSLQFGNYSEPLLIMAVIPLALIGAIWGHILMGHNFSMPSMMGFVSLSGIVVNNSILLSEFVRLRLEGGANLKEAAAGAASDRFRAIFITTVTTLAGMLPLLFETSLQAQVLIPLVISLTFGLATSAMMVLFVIPAFYSIRADLQANQAHNKQP